MRKILEFIKRLGIVEGPTFRTVHEDGVGVFIEPNPNPTRMQPQAVELPAPVRKDGNWTARRVYLSDRFPFIQ